MTRTALPKSSANSGGFTLLELLVTITIGVMLMLTATTFFIMATIGQAKLRADQRIKFEGNSALRRIVTLIQNTKSMTANDDGQICQANMSNVALIGADGGKTVIKIVTDAVDTRIASVAASTNTNYYLTSGFGEFLPADTITFNCYANDIGEPTYVEVLFNLKYGPGVSADKDTVIENFRAGALLRSKFYQ